VGDANSKPPSRATDYALRVDQTPDTPGHRLIELPVIRDMRGNLTYVEAEREAPFDIRRVYYLYDVPGGESRAGHAHRELQQLLIAVAGSFDVVLDSGQTRETVTLNRSYVGLYIPRLIWRELENFSSGAVCLALASDYFDESDYIRDYGQFLEETAISV
jgi:dTDP-4-dehydrorhamnose 3,5-epimerase-like enzyme